MGVVDLATSLVGKIKYKLGADNIENGIGDCSDFTQYVYNQHGVDIGPDTRAQLANTERVNKEDLQPGDLVFFQGTYRKGVSHVGIYIGNGQFVHNSSGAGKTVIADLSNSYWIEHWLSGGRVNGVNASGPTTNTGNNTINTGLISGTKATVKTIASGAVKAVIILILLILAFVLCTQAFGFKIGG